MQYPNCRLKTPKMILAEREPYRYLLRQNKRKGIITLEYPRPDMPYIYARGDKLYKISRAGIFATSPSMLAGLAVTPTLSTINADTITMEPSCMDYVTVEEQGLQSGRKQPEGRNKLACKSNDITMTPAQESRNTTSDTRKGGHEQSAPKKTRGERKKGLFKFFCNGARVPPMSTEGTPMNAAKMRWTSATGPSGSQNKRDNTNGNNVISSKKSKSDNKDSHREVANLENMDATPLKPKGSQSRSRKGQPKRTRRQKHPSLGRKRHHLPKSWEKRD